VSSRLADELETNQESPFLSTTMDVISRPTADLGTLAGSSLTRVRVVAGPEAFSAAEGAAAALRADGQDVQVVPVDDLQRLADADAVLVLGGAGLEAAVRAVAPTAHVDAELLEGPAERWEGMVLRATKLLTAAPTSPQVPSFLHDFVELCG
jgi:hypothetical protein